MAYPVFTGVEDFEAWPKLAKRVRQIGRAPLPAARRAVPVPAGRAIFRKKDRLKRALALSGQWSDLGDPEISVLAAHPEMEEVLSDAAWASPEWGMGDDETLEGFKLKKVLKKVGKIVKKVLPLVVGIGIGALSAGAWPALTAAMGKGMGVAMGGLKWAGNKLLAAPKAVVDAFTAQGKNVATATPEEIISVAQAVGAITPQTKPAIETAPAPAPAPYYPPAAPAPYYPPAEAAPAREFAPAAPALPTYLPYLLGGGALALVLLPRLMERRA